MKRTLILTPGLLIAALAVALTATLSHGSSQASGGPRIVSAFGVAEVQGERLWVHITVLVPAGQDARAAAEAALREQGARPATPRDLESNEYSTTGLVWDEFSDGSGDNDYVLQNYNPAGDATGGDGEAALLATHATWTDVPTSKFAFSYGSTTNRCPSLVRECPGAQVFDGFNDVGWGPLSCNFMRCTLGVTWSSSSIDEADMWLNTAASWHAGATSCTNVGGQYDLQTVIAHENGHVAGLGHSSVQQALMYAYYSGTHCQLHQDDIDGISALYPEGDPPAPTDTPLPTDTPTPTFTPDPNAPTATPTPCPRGWIKNGRCPA